MIDTIQNRPPTPSVRPLRALVPFLARHKGLATAAALALIVAAVVQLALPIAIRVIIDNGLATEDAQQINRYFLLFIAGTVAFGGFTGLRMYLLARLGERVMGDLRSAVYERVVRLDPAFFAATPTGEVLSRLTTDTTLVQSILNLGVTVSLRSIIVIAGSIALLVVTSPLLAGLVTLLLPLVVVPVMVLGRRVRRLSRASQDHLANVSAVAGESFNGIETLQLFNLEPLFSSRFDSEVEASYGAALKRSAALSWMVAIASAFVLTAVAVTLWVGARLVLQGALTFGLLSQFLLYAVYAGSSAAALSEMWGEVQRAAGAVERLAELLLASPTVRSPREVRAFPAKLRGEIRFDGVSFHYPSRADSPALSVVGFCIAAGEKVAVVGPSGAGKTTIIKLLTRFYDPSSGRILVDGIPIEDVSPEEVRRRIGVVSQDIVLFSASARENIRFGRPHATDAEVEAAARAAAADEFIRGLPQGYDTYLGEKGASLSGGERQRIAIARAVLKNPPILLLDEATSSLDASSERAVQRAIRGLTQGRTTVAIAHRLATVRGSDRIIVVDGGRVAAIGNHERLLDSSALYARLVRLQLAADTAAESPRTELAELAKV